MCFVFFLSGIEGWSQVTNSFPEIPLNSGWKFHKVGDNDWMPATVPGTVHTDLLANNKIPDPFFGSNEKDLQWIENETWEYHRSILLLEKVKSTEQLWLCFEGLDTYASVTLNGTRILSADNMFRRWEINVTDILKPGGNELLVSFAPAVQVAKELSSRLPYKLPGDDRVNVRKAQYQFGWDWGPRYVTCGIWKAVYLKRTDLSYPGNNLIDIRSKKKVELVQETDAAGKSFYFRIDNKPVFMKGANWIPLDHFIPRITDPQYRKALISVKEAGMNMLRVWGGGIYEQDIFYRLCDSLGIYVWQDFMFACGMYPGDSLFMGNVMKEAEYQVKRLSQYDCVILWCGNNEISEGWNNWGWQKQYKITPSDSVKMWKDYLKLFKHMLPSVVKQHSNRPYVSTSPAHGWGRKESLTEGDCHYWGVWWGKQPFEIYEEKIPRFMSEYGFQGMPSVNSFKRFCRPDQLKLGSDDVKSHQKHPTGFETINEYMKMYYRKPKDFESAIYVSQLLQADAYRIAIESHRNSMPYCMGTLMWQLNDTWPVTSWSAVDYYGEKKAVWYQLKRSYGSVMLSVKEKGDSLVFNVVSERGDSVDASFAILPYFADGKTVEMLSGKTKLKPFGKSTMLTTHKKNYSFSSPDHYFVRFLLTWDKQSAETNYFFVPYSGFNFQEPKITWEYQAATDSVTLILKCEAFAKSVYLNLGDGITFSENYFDMYPGETKKVKVSAPVGWNAEKNLKQLKIMSLYDSYEH